MSRFVLDGGEAYDGQAVESVAEGVGAMAVDDDGNEEDNKRECNATDGEPQQAAASNDSETSSSCPAATRTSPVVVLVIGMAGAGKTTLMHRINLFMLERGMKGYYVNLDPAVRNVPFAANIDIRDTVNYKEVMKQYGLGPNGAILTSLNLFATRFDQVVGILERRAADIDYIFIDTPGQIEAFTWSAGGQIMTDLLGTSFPTCVLYITDTPRCSSTTTFMSNMLNSCSVLYKSRLPMVCVFNKCDVTPCDFAKEWMTDFEAYQASVDVDKEEYMGSLNRSLSLVMEEFYKNIRTVGVSAVTGEGILDLFQHIDDAAKEFRESYLPDLLRRTEERKQRELAKQEQDMARLQKDLDATKGDRVVVDANDPEGESAPTPTQFGVRV